MRPFVAFTLMVMVCLLVLFATLIGYVLLGVTQQLQTINEDIDFMLRQQKLQFERQSNLEGKHDELRDKQDALLDIFSDAEVSNFTVTAYAPLDPNAVRGMDYSGDPSKTASGKPPIPYETVAASKEFAFGQRLWVEGVGVVTVNDRGGAISRGRLDLAVQSRTEALTWGRKRLKVVVL